ncbi:10688_t:CDS:2, partial [Dentiscutata erythropus]
LRKIIMIIYSSPQRREKFFQYNPNNLELILDVKTRWNSTYYMLKRALELRENFEQATINISGCKYSTIGLVIPYYHDLLDALEKFINNCSDLIIKEAIKKARTKLNKYYSDANNYYGENGFNNKDIEIYRNQIQELWKSKYQPTQTSVDENISNENVPRIFKKRKTIYNDELEIYLRNPTVNPYFFDDILLWWKNHECEFKYLSKMAKDYLSVQATSVSVERAFSAAKELITSRRCNLNPTTIRA